VRSGDSGTMAAPMAMREYLEPVAGTELGLLLQSIAEQALTTTRATGAAIAISRGEEMICVASAGPDAPSLGARLQIGSGFSGECVRTRKLLRCDDSETDQRVDRETCLALGVRSIVAVPVLSGGVVAGLLEMFSPKVLAFSGARDAAFEHFADEVSIALSGSAGSWVVPRKLPRTPARVNRPAGGTFAISDRELPDAEAPLWYQPPAPRSRKAILIAAAALVIAATSLIVPRVRTAIGVSEQGNREPQIEPQMPVYQPLTPSVAAAGDFASLRRSAKQGDPAAQFAVGARFATGEDVNQDYAEAARWFSMAAEQGHIVAQSTLGAYYWAGRGVPQDLTKAYFWSILAQAGGDQAGKYRVAILTPRMTRSQVLAAQQEANDWLEHHQSSGKLSPHIR
jgi:GAF domain/Sel1 repeat